MVAPMQEYPSHIILFDATLFVNAYETQLFRTGLYRVSEQLLLQLLEQYPSEQIYLYDTQQRNRLLRQAVLPAYAGVRLLDTDSPMYVRLTDKALQQADYCREREHAAKQNGRAKGWKLLKNTLRTYGKICSRLLPPKPVMLPAPAACLRYIATYYPIPQWVHLQGIQATLILHDLIPLIHPEWFPNEANQHTLQAIIHSPTNQDRVVCVSQSTMNDFLTYRPDFPTNQIAVAHLAGFNHTKVVPSSEPPFDGLPYLLSVCTIEPRKNLSTVLKAYQSLLQQYGEKTPLLVLVGAMGWKTDSLMQTIHKLQQQYPNKIIITGYVDDDTLIRFYTHAALFLYPSLYEGFGLPPLEAMACGCPVITSNVSSLPEVVGDAGWKVAPTDEQAIVKAIEQVLQADRDQLRVRSLAQAQQFSWKKFADKIIESFA